MALTHLLLLTLPLAIMISFTHTMSTALMEDKDKALGHAMRGTSLNTAAIPMIHSRHRDQDMVESNPEVTHATNTGQVVLPLLLQEVDHILISDGATGEIPHSGAKESSTMMVTHVRDGAKIAGRAGTDWKLKKETGIERRENDANRGKKNPLDE